jgi:hypothetical protein
VPVTWSISHPEQLVVAIAEGEIRREDVDNYLTGITDAGGMPYRKLVDFTFAPLNLSAVDIRVLGQRVADAGKLGKVGPLAMVVGSELAMDVAKMFKAAARADRPIEIFSNIPEAREWLDQVAPPVSGAKSVVS